MRTLLRHGALAVVLVALAAFVAGCGKGTSSTNPGTPMTQDSADDIAINTVAALSALDGDVQTAASVGMGGPAPQGAARLERAQWDTTFTRGGINYSASARFYDALDNELPGYGPLAVRFVWTSDASGSWTTERDTATVGHHTQLIVTGIQVTRDTLTFNGTADDTLTNRFRSYDGTRTRYFHWVSSLLISAVQWAKASEYPASGTLTFTVSADRLRSGQAGDVEAHWNATVVITFNGTAMPDVVVNGTWRYRWNMVTGMITRA